MSNAFTDLLAEKGTLLADGATGTNLFNMGLMSGDAPEMWNTDEPKKIIKLYRFAVDSGSDLFLTNSFGANASRLKLHGAEKRVHELSRVSAELAREVADTAERKVIVAGSVGPTGEIMEPVGTLTHSLAVEMFHETADGLKAGGADIGWLETISAPEEYRAAAEGFALAGLPWCGTMSFDTAGRTMMGLTSEGMVDMVHGLDNTPLAYGANCGTGASDLLRTVLGFAAKNGTLPIISKGNSGVPS
jgi:5-methyltetrahydrofolate--homocysteine methyltransferase